MERARVNRRGFLSKLAAVAGGVALLPALAQPARARSWRRGWGFGRGFGGFRGYGWGSHRRFFGGPYFGGMPFSRGYGYGYGVGPGVGYGVGPGFGYGPGIVGPQVYSRGYFGAPYYGPGYGAPGAIFLPMNHPGSSPFARLKLLES